MISMNNRFYFNEENRQHITLSSHAMMVIEGDMINFNKDYNLYNKSGFINKIIANYYDKFPLSPNAVLNQIESIGRSLQNDDFGKQITNRIIEEFCEEIMRRAIVEYSKKFSTDVPFKLKVNQENRNLLEGLEEAKYYFKYVPRSPPAFYIKILLETYALLFREERERIFYRRTIEIIESSIQNKTYLKFKYDNKIYKSVALYIYRPYNKQNLEIVVATPHQSNENEGARIDTIKLKDIKEQEIKELKEKSRSELKKGVVDFVFNTLRIFEEKSQKPLELFTLKFTPYGLERFVIEEDNIPLVGIQDCVDETVFTFKATESQIFQHFLSLEHKHKSSFLLKQEKDLKNYIKLLMKSMINW